MGSPHRISHMLYEAAKEMTDPGAGGTIRPNKDLQICEMTSATTETRTLARPTKGGIRLIVRLYSAGGNITLTVTGGMNVDGDTEATFADAGDFLSFVSVKASATTYRWQILEGNIGVVVSSASVSSTPSSSVSATPSSTPSSSVSATPSSSVSATPSTSPSATS
jgi:hypothetical protein